MTTTEEHDRAIRRASRAGTYQDPTRSRGTSKPARRRKRVRQLNRAKSSNLTSELLPTKSQEDEDASTEVATYYKSHERMGIMFFAIQTSVEEAAEVAGVTKDTIYRWFQEEGGIVQIKEYVQSKVEVSLHETIDLFLGELPNRLEGMSNKEYFSTFRELLHAGEKAGLFTKPAIQRGGKGGGSSGSSGESPGDTEQPGIHFHLTSPPAPEEPKGPDSVKPSPTQTSTPEEAEAKEEAPMPSVFDE